MTSSTQPCVEPASAEIVDALFERITKLRKDNDRSVKIYAVPFIPSKLGKCVDLTGSSDELLTRARKLQTSKTLDSLLVLGPSFLSDAIDVLLNAPQVLQKRKGRRIKIYSATNHSDCPLVNSASTNDLLDCWNALQNLFDADAKVFPIACLSSSLAVKAFCGERNGAVCTSVNARFILDRALELRPKVLFVPDSNLGRFAAYSVGCRASDVVLWRQESRRPDVLSINGGTEEATLPENHSQFNNDTDLRLRKLILWDSVCPTYGNLEPEQIAQLRETHPNVKIAVPPRCSEKVQTLADSVGDLNDLIVDVADSDPRTIWAIGFEKNYFTTLKKQFPERSFLIFNEENTASCEARTLIPSRVEAALDSLEEGSAANSTATPEFLAEPAYNALEQMFQMLE